GRYLQADSIRPGYGYWVKFDSSGKCLLGPGNVASPSFAGHTDLSSLNRLILTDASGYRQTLYFGKPSAEFSDLPPVPPSGVPDVRFSTGESVGYLTGDRSLTVLLNSLNYPVLLQWEVQTKFRL